MIRYKTCIYVANFYKEIDEDYRFIENGPVGLEIEEGGQVETVNAVETEGNVEFCSTKSIEPIKLVLVKEKVELDNIFIGACNTDLDECIVEGKTKILFQIKYLNKASSILTIVMIAFASGVAFNETIIRFAYLFLLRGFPMKNENSITKKK